MSARQLREDIAAAGNVYQIELDIALETVRRMAEQVAVQALKAAAERPAGIIQDHQNPDRHGEQEGGAA